MKKFDRLPAPERKQEICAAALKLFCSKGFAATTMENIVEQVSLSKGGVYRLYSSTTAILSDLMLEGMHLRNAFYEQRVQQEQAAGRALTPEFLVGMIADSLLLYPEISGVYVEFLWEKRRNPQLETLYRDICAETTGETLALMEKYGAAGLLPAGAAGLEKLTDLMNAAVLSMHILGLRDTLCADREKLSALMIRVLNI